MPPRAPMTRVVMMCSSRKISPGEGEHRHVGDPRNEQEPVTTRLTCNAVPQGAQPRPDAFRYSRLRATAVTGEAFRRRTSPTGTVALSARRARPHGEPGDQHLSCAASARAAPRPAGCSGQSAARIHAHPTRAKRSCSVSGWCLSNGPVRPVCARLVGNVSVAASDSPLAAT